MRLAAFVAIAHQPGLPENAEMLGYRRLRDAGLRRQRPDQKQAFGGAKFGWQKFFAELERVVGGLS